MIEETLVTLLNSIASVYPGRKPEKTSFPCIVYQRIETQSNNHQTDKSLARARIQVSCLAKTYNEVKSITSQVISKLDLNTTNFIMSTLINNFDEFESEEKIYKVILEFYIWE